MQNETKSNDDESFICCECGDTFLLKDDTKHTHNDKIYCNDCFNELFSYCEDCLEYCDSDNMKSVYDGDRYVCDSCYEENYFYCEGCGYSRHNVDYCEDNRCNQCCDNYDDERHPNVNRPYSKNDDLVNKDHRAYSCEIECYYKKYNELETVASEIHKSIGISDDGSLGEYGKEFQTPKLSGTKGDKVLKDLCKTLNKNNCYVDRTCGLHIHLDTSDMACDTTPRLTKYEKDMLIGLENSNLNVKDFLRGFGGYIIWKRIVELILERKPQTKYFEEIIAQLKEWRDITSIETLNDIAKEINFEDGTSIMWDTTRTNPLYTLETDVRTLHRPVTIASMIIQEEFNDSYQVCGGSSDYEKFRKIKNIMLFYIAFEPVIYSYLPMSRRTNRYCMPISSFFHEKEIENCNNYKDLEKIWYREIDHETIEERKANKYDDTRYCGVNMHSLFSNNHIEIRFHSGTIDYKKIKMWADLHIAILDAISQNKINSDKLRTIKYTLDLSQKQDEMFKMINLPKNIQDYFKARQQTFGTITKENENICVE